MQPMFGSLSSKLSTSCCCALRVVRTHSLFSRGLPSSPAFCQRVTTRKKWAKKWKGKTDQDCTVHRMMNLCWMFCCTCWILCQLDMLMHYMQYKGSRCCCLHLAQTECRNLHCTSMSILLCCWSSGYSGVCCYTLHMPFHLGKTHPAFFKELVLRKHGQTNKKGKPCLQQIFFPGGAHSVANSALPVCGNGAWYSLIISWCLACRSALFAFVGYSILEKIGRTCLTIWQACTSIFGSVRIVCRTLCTWNCSSSNRGGGSLCFGI